MIVAQNLLNESAEHGEEILQNRLLIQQIGIIH